MDARHFDQLARSFSAAGSRRGLLGFLTTLPLLGGLFALLDAGELDAKGRRKRRKQRHKKRTGNRKKNRKGKRKGKKKCTPDSVAQTCTGRCGPVNNNCNESVDCGSCACTPPCATCFTCQGEAGQPGTCVPAAGGAPCGDAATCEAGIVTPRGSCDGSGACQPGTPLSCDPYTTCDGNTCATACSDNEACVDGSFCNGDGRCVGDKPDGDPCDHHGQCASGFCVDGVCCNNACAGDCEACNLSGNVGACTTEDDGAGCGGSNVCCTGVCQACCDSGDCSGAIPICDAGACEACTSNTACENAGKGDLCCSDGCVTGICCADETCTTEEAPDCVDHQCVCAANSDDPCDAGETCCDDGCANLDIDPDHCGTCDQSCTGDTPVCWNGACVCGDVCASGCQFTTVQTAIEAASSGAAIRICAGSFGAIAITKNLTLTGAGDGSAASSNTILDAARQGRVVSIDPGVAVTLQGLRITGGKVTDTDGAGIRNRGKLTMTDCTVTANNAVPGQIGFGSAGGIANYTTDNLTMTNCTISQNSAGVQAGGITLLQGTHTLTNCTFTGNTANDEGGAIFCNNGGATTLAGCTIGPDNDALDGAIEVWNSTLTLDATTVSGNTGSNNGGITNSSGVVILQNGSTVSGNTPSNCAGAITGPGCAA